ncbi:DNA mismatch repair protein MutS [Peptostreptococcaceae bacterium pGA-8]|nr:DNA mismatch repair protein MutS [Peptostreptococcaceae bacterium pGA-8]
MKLSPMMEQYNEIKKEYSDCILFFRLGDFYEMFFQDALTASKALELTLTGRNCGLEEKAPMCGVPFHSADNYIARLVEKGFKVAICEQVEDPAVAKGIVKREVIKVITPGTVTSEAMLRDDENNYLASLYYDGRVMALSYADISTGELAVTEEAVYENIIYDFISELIKIGAKEIIANKLFQEEFEENNLLKGADLRIEYKDDIYFNYESGINTVKSQFNIRTLSSIGLDNANGAVSSLGGLLSYLIETQKTALKQLIKCNTYKMGKHMSLDRTTLRNLEITETLFDKNVKGSLLGILNKTHTAMGSRMLRKWLSRPLNNCAEINLRLDFIEELYNNPLLLNDIREALKGIYDFQRLTGRIASGNANGRDLLALKASVEHIPNIKDLLSECNSSLSEKINQKMDSLEYIYEIIDASISNEPPFTLKDGGIIKDGYSLDLDGLKNSIKDGKEWISSLEEIERERTGIKTLKVGYNKVFGYFIEVTKANSDNVPEDYIRKQTLVNNERYITPKMKEIENIVLNGEAKINRLEYELFCHIREQLAEYIEELQRTSEMIANLDALCSFAHVSLALGYVRPVVDDGNVLEIEDGRHPVIEQTINDGIFVSNDTYLDSEKASMAIITGPNMAGKSTYMRQTALIVLMAQSGCFVPCASAHIGVVDRIFTRIGASDNLASGQSTFFVEMSELAYILNCATEKSLIILDEIGRGTSTYDGMSIAFATADYLCNEHRHIRTMFATHYHELTVLEGKVSGVINLNVDVLEEDGNIVFLHKIVPGSASKSYGIHVAKLAGVPETLLREAQLRLEHLESDNKSHESRWYNPDDGHDKIEEQLSLFNMDSPVVDKLKEINLMELTPSRAIGLIEELKELL